MGVYVCKLWGVESAPISTRSMVSTRGSKCAPKIRSWPMLGWNTSYPFTAWDPEEATSRVIFGPRILGNEWETRLGSGAQKGLGEGRVGHRRYDERFGPRLAGEWRRKCYRWVLVVICMIMGYRWQLFPPSTRYGNRSPWAGFCREWLLQLHQHDYSYTDGTGFGTKVHPSVVMLLRVASTVVLSPVWA